MTSYYIEFNWEDADQNFKRALELNCYAEFLATEGKFEESFAKYEGELEVELLIFPQ